jgi:hypothetical protein
MVDSQWHCAFDLMFKPSIKLFKKRERIRRTVIRERDTFYHGRITVA